MSTPALCENVGIEDEKDIASHLEYLSQKRFIEVKSIKQFGSVPNIYDVKILSAGIDYLDNLPEPNRHDYVRIKILERMDDVGRINVQELRGLVVKDGDIQIEEFDREVKYLTSKNRIKQKRASGKLEITAAGIDAIKPSEFGDQAPSVQVTNITNISIENFLVNYEKIIRDAEIPEEEKESLIKKGKDFITNPNNLYDFAKVLYEYFKNNPQG